MLLFDSFGCGFATTCGPMWNGSPISHLRVYSVEEGKLLSYLPKTGSHLMLLWDRTPPAPFAKCKQSIWHIPVAHTHRTFSPFITEGNFTLLYIMGPKMKKEKHLRCQPICSRSIYTNKYTESRRLPAAHGHSRHRSFHMMWGCFSASVSCCNTIRRAGAHILFTHNISAKFVVAAWDGEPNATTTSSSPAQNERVRIFSSCYSLY